ncbi:MAG: choice-of-anchor D domain-containing protein [Verrucomicrobiota bacterium]
MNIQDFVISSFALPVAFCLMAQPLSADPATDSRMVPEIDVQQPARNSLEDDFSKTTCGIAVIGKSGPTKKFTIRNVGSGPLTGLSITRDGVNAKEFKVTQPAKTTLAPGTSTTFTVTFKPTGKGTRSAEIHIKSNDADESPFDVVLTGKGLAR